MPSQCWVYLYPSPQSSHPRSFLRAAVTILVPLSDTDSFSGGGTAFWSDADRGPRVGAQSQVFGGAAEPSFVLRPPAGTAIIFGGRVAHAGMPVVSGTRCVFVASFSPLEAEGGALLAMRRKAAEAAETNEMIRLAMDWRRRRNGAANGSRRRRGCKPPSGEVDTANQLAAFARMRLQDSDTD